MIWSTENGKPWCYLYNTLAPQTRAQLQNPSAALSECLVNYVFSSPACVCAPEMAYTQDRKIKTNWVVKFTQPWNSAARNCKRSYRKCLIEYESSRVHTYGAKHQSWKVHNYLSSFIMIFLWSHYLENATPCSVSQGVRRTPCTPGVYAPEQAITWASYYLLRNGLKTSRLTTPLQET